MNRKRRDVNNNDLKSNTDSYGSQFPEDDNNITTPQHEYKTEIVNGKHSKIYICIVFWRLASYKSV